MFEKFKSSGDMRDLKIPRWSGEERIRPMSKMWHDSFSGSGVSGGPSLRLLKMYMGVRGV